MSSTEMSSEYELIINEIRNAKDEILQAIRVSNMTVNKELNDSNERTMTIGELDSIGDLDSKDDLDSMDKPMSMSELNVSKGGKKPRKTQRKSSYKRKNKKTKRVKFHL